MTVEQKIRPLDVSCAHLDLMRWQMQAQGEVFITKSRPLIPARQAILEEIAGASIRFVDEVSNFAAEIPEVSDPKHQKLIGETRKESELTGCWWVQAGCIVTDRRGRIRRRAHNDPAVGKESCRILKLPPDEVLQMLGPGERLEFCQGVHDVEIMTAQAAAGGGRLTNKNWYLSLEPCDRCAGILTRLEPDAVYFSIGQNRKRYYNSLGLERLVMANIPTFFVRMPGE